MDLSNFPKDHPLYNTQNKGVLGKIKNEMSAKHIESFVCLQPKLYSILTTCNTHKKSVKGITHANQMLLRHEKFVSVYNKSIPDVFTTEVGIRSKNHQLKTIQTTKRAISCMDTKRYWVNKEISYGYNHPEINRIRLINTNNMPGPSTTTTSQCPSTCQCKKCRLARKRKIASISGGDELVLNLNHKKLQPARVIYTID